jgi:hypothetical protein
LAGAVDFTPANSTTAPLGESGRFGGFFESWATADPTKISSKKVHRDMARLLQYRGGNVRASV